MRIIIDTDIGSDIDDAVALAWLLARSDCEIVGITTVSGEPEQRARLASVLCRVAGREVPIYPGVALPMLTGQCQPEAPQAAALARWPHQQAFAAGEAIEFLRRSVRAEPGELTLLTLGPLTNIGYLLAIDPDAAQMFRSVVSMVGAFKQPAAPGQLREWNALCDPYALDTVMRAPIPDHRIVPLDVTLSLSMPAAMVRNRFRHRLLTPVLDFAEAWFARTDHVVFHDPLAAICLFDTEVCGWQQGACDVDLLPREAGRTIWRADPAGRHKVASSVDPDRFFSRFFDVFA